MENKNTQTRRLNSQYALRIFVYVCAILVLIILYSSFQRTDGGVLSGEIYLRPNVVESIEK